MRNLKKILGLIVALSVVLTIAASSMMASASLLGGLFDSWFGGGKSSTSTSSTATTSTTQRQPLINFYIDYDVTRTLAWGFSFGCKPTTSTPVTVTDPTVPEESKTNPSTTETPSTTEEVTEGERILASAPTENVTATPVAKAEIADTGEAGASVVVALALVSGAAVVLTRKKNS